jgi:hypothetical protein
VDRRCVLTQLEIFSEIIAAEKNTKKGKTPAAKKGKREVRKVKHESIDNSGASQDKRLEILDCIVAKS